MTTFGEAIDSITNRDRLGAAVKKILEPTDRQRVVLGFIDSGRRRNGYPPTIRELAELLEVKSLHAVACHLAALKRKGFVEWTATKGRTLSVTTAGRAWLPREAA